MSLLSGTGERLRDADKAYVLTALLVVAFLVRVWALTYGLPFSYEFTSDAEHYVPDAVNISLRDLSPHWFGHPGSTVIYPLGFVFHLSNRVARAVGLTELNVSQSFQQDPTPYYASGRLLAALEGTVTVLIVYLIGREISSRRTGLIAAALLAVSPLHVFVCHLARDDAAVVLFTTLSLLFCVKILKRRAWSYYVAAGVSAGLAMSSKYYGVLVIACLPIAHLVGGHIQRRRGAEVTEKDTLLRLMVGLACVPVAFALTSPFVILEFDTAWADIMRERRTTHLSADGLSPLGNLSFYMTEAAPIAVGWGAIALIPAGLWRVTKRRMSSMLVLCAFAVLFVAAISLQALHWPRWLLPAVPVLVVLSAVGLQQVLEWLQTLLKDRFMRCLAVSLLLTLVAWAPASQTIMGEINRSLPDTRMLAREWIEENVPPGSQIATDAYAAPLDADQFSVLRKFSVSYESLDYYRQRGIEHLVTSSIMYERLAAEPERYQSNIEFYEVLQRDGTLTYQIAPISWQRTGPTVSVYRMPMLDASP